MKLIGGDWNPGAAHIGDEKATKKKEAKKKVPETYQRPVLKPMDGDKVSLLANQLCKQESLSKVQKAELDEKTAKLEKVKTEIIFYKMIKGDSKQTELHRMEEEHKQLEKENTEMRNFLNEYGLKWVGKSEQNKKDFDFSKLQQKMQEQANQEIKKELDLEQVAKRIEELNVIAERDAKKFVEKDGAHIFAKQPPLPIGFFMNGLIIKGYRFHEYTSKEAQSILGDIMEGYFPYDLKGRYPDGVIFKIVDHTEEMYDVKNYLPKDNVRNILNIDEQFRPLTKEEFLNQLPEKVIKNGKIIEIRSEVGKKMGVMPEPGKDPSGNQQIETHVDFAAAKGTPYPEADITTLRIRSQKATHCLLVKLLSSDTIKTLYDLLAKFSETKGNFTLLQSFPRIEFPITETRTLKELGLTPSAALIMH